MVSQLEKPPKGSHSLVSFMYFTNRNPAANVLMRCNIQMKYPCGESWSKENLVPSFPFWLAYTQLTQRKDKRTKFPWMHESEFRSACAGQVTTGHCSGELLLVLCILAEFLFLNKFANLVVCLSKHEHQLLITDFVFKMLGFLLILSLC